MNKKGYIIFFLFMLALIVILLALYLAPSLKESIEIARNPSNLDCENTSISTVNKVTCIATDITTTYFMGFLIFLGGTIIGAKLLFGGGD